jgi:hypothetical protein
VTRVIITIRHPRRSDAVVWGALEVHWPTPPPKGATWTCCDRMGACKAQVESVVWGGADGEPDLWVVATTYDWRAGHLLSEHGFGSGVAPAGQWEGQ